MSLPALYVIFFLSKPFDKMSESNEKEKKSACAESAMAYFEIFIQCIREVSKSVDRLTRNFIFARMHHRPKMNCCR